MIIVIKTDTFSGSILFQKYQDFKAIISHLSLSATQEVHISTSSGLYRNITHTPLTREC